MQLPAIANRSSLDRAGRLAAMTFCLTVASPAYAQNEKAPEDPTKIATKAGVSYSDDEFSVSGSLAVGPKIKFNGRISESGMWSVGASYLFPVAILTFAAAKNELSTGVEQIRYSLGGFVPVTELGLKTDKWNLFVPFGYTYTKGTWPVTDVDQNENLSIELSSNSGYFGIFVLRPLSKKFTLMAGGIVTKGTNDFSGFAAGGGLSYHLTQNDTLRLSASYNDNSFGQKNKVNIAYVHEF